MVNYSQNGWIASANRAQINVITPWRIAGVEFVGGVRGGAVTTVLGYVAVEFHNRVEPLDHGCCWGWAWRSIAGSIALTNHASGTAIDINAPRHPLGAKGTFSIRQVGEIQSILAETYGTVRWGGNYSGRKDEMHFEINGNRAQVEDAETRILTRAAKPLRKVAHTMRTLYVKGNVNPDIYCCTFDGKSVSKRWVSPQEWAILHASGEMLVNVQQNQVDGLTEGADT